MGATGHRQLGHPREEQVACQEDILLLEARAQLAPLRGCAPGRRGRPRGADCGGSFNFDAQRRPH